MNELFDSKQDGLCPHLLVEALLLELHEGLVAHHNRVAALLHPLQVAGLQKVDHLIELFSGLDDFLWLTEAILPQLVSDKGFYHGIPDLAYVVNNASESIALHHAAQFCLKSL